VPSLAAAVSYDADAGRTAVFLVNRSQESPTEVAVDLSGVGGGNVEAWTISDPDPHVCNTISAPDRVRPELNHTARHEDGVLSISLPPVSWTAITIGASG
jgi:alpha-N-arabinofuranosidase